MKVWFVKLKGKLKVPRNNLLGALVFVWFWADRGDNVDGHAVRSGDGEYLDAFAELNGLYAAMEAVGLIRTEGEKLVFVDYFTNKTRMLTRARVQRFRDQQQQDGTPDETPTRDESPECNASETECNASEIRKAEQSIGEERKAEERKNQEVESGVAHRNRGGCKGGASDWQADGASAPNKNHAGEPYSDWTPEFISRVRAIACERFGPLTKPHAGYMPEDRDTILKIAACEALGVVSEGWVPDALRALEDRLSPDSISQNGPVRNHARWVFGSLEKTAVQHCGRTYQQILGRVKLPEELKRPPPRNG